MADEFQLGSGNWWNNNTTRNRLGAETTPASISTAIGTYGGSLVLEGAAAAAAHEQSSNGGAMATPDLQTMGLCLSSQAMDWNQAIFARGEKENSFRSMIQEDFSSNDFKQINRGFSLDQPQASSNDSSITYGGLLLSENQQNHSAYDNPSMNYNPYQSSGGYGANAAAELMPSWNKFPQFLRTSPPRPAAPPPPLASDSHLHFTNINTPFWNASPPAAAMADVRSSFFPALQTQIFNPAAQSFDEKPKIKSEVRELSATTKKNITETSNKRPRNETPSPLPAFKVRKEKMGDRITALQQLVSPFGKTDTASVLTEAIEYIKFLHEQVSLLSDPYMKNGAPTQRLQQNCDKMKVDPAEGPRQDLRSRGLCLVPVSSTFPMTHETTAEFWAPTFGVSFR